MRWFILARKLNPWGHRRVLKRIEALEHELGLDMPEPEPLAAETVDLGPGMVWPVRHHDDVQIVGNPYAVAKRPRKTRWQELQDVNARLEMLAKAPPVQTWAASATYFTDPRWIWTGEKHDG